MMIMIEQLYVLIYLIVFIVGAICGLLYSYQKHLEPYVIKETNIPILVMAIVGWFLCINFGLFSFIPSFILISIGLFLVGFVIDMRPGYGRRETVIGIVIAVIIWFFTQCLFNII
jgi:energy-converting hydrogenase A subunit L